MVRALTTGDFDLCTMRPPELEEEMQKLGFVRPSGAGQMLKGWIHPELKLGFEVVADTRMDDAFDRLEQARKLFCLQTSLDRAYLDRRIKEETAGDYGIESLS